MYTDLARAMVKISLAAVILLNASVAAGQVLFQDDFEGTLTAPNVWVGKDGMTSGHSGQIVLDPLDGTFTNHVLNFMAVTLGGDIFGPEVTVAPGTTYLLAFDYLGFPSGDDLGGTIGFADETPGNHRWLAGTNDHSSIENQVLVDDGAWHSHSFEFDPAGISTDDAIRVMLEDFSFSGPTAGDAYFDNIVLYEFTEGEAGEGDNVLFFNQGNAGGSHPLTAGYQVVIDPGPVDIFCCRVKDTREGTGTTRRYGDFDPINFDIGDQFFRPDPDDVEEPLNPSCAAMPDIGSDVFVVRPWQRGVPKADRLALIDDIAGPNDLGVCVVQSLAVTKGVFYTEEAPENVLGYTLNYGAEPIENRPYTGGVALPFTGGEPSNTGEIDAPFVVRWSAETNGGRSAKKGSDNGFIVNLRHYSPQNDTKAYLSRMAGNLLDSIEYERSRVEDLLADPIVPAPCVDNTANFLDDLFDRVTVAKQNFAKKGNPDTSEIYLDMATELALLLTYTGPGDPYDVNPLNNPSEGTCPGNPKGLFVGRLMALKHANCSERRHAGPNGDGLEDNAKAPGNCAIATDIRNALPPLP